MMSNPCESPLEPVTLPLAVIFDECSTMALKCAEIYRLLGEKHAPFANLEGVWCKAFNEQRSNANLFKRLSSRKDSYSLSIDDQVGNAQSVIYHLDSILRPLQRTPVLPVPALQFAIRLETYLSRFLSQSVTVCNDTELKKLLETMLETSLSHVEMFKRTLQEWLPGEEAFKKIHDAIDDLFCNMQKSGFGQVDILKVAAKFEGRLAQYLQSTNVGEHAGVRDLLNCLADKNQDYITRIKVEIEKAVVKEKGTA
jgi:rubrerythrin